LVSMIGMIIKSLEDFSTFASVVVQLGGRHEIYGVESSDYECFARVLSETVAKLLDSDSEDVQSVWYKCMISLSNIMTFSQKVAQDEHGLVICWRKLSVGSAWKQSCTRLTLDSVYIFNSTEANKLRSSISMKVIKEISMFQPEELDSNFPSEHGFYLIHTNDEKMSFCFETAEEAIQYFDALNWRVQAQQRVFKYADDVSGDSEESSSKEKDFSPKMSSSTSEKKNSASSNNNKYKFRIIF